MSNGDIITIVFGVLTILGAGAGWLTATYMRIGKILYEIKYMNQEVQTLTIAFDNQVKKVDNHEIRLTKLETEREVSHNHHSHDLAST